MSHNNSRIELTEMSSDFAKFSCFIYLWWTMHKEYPCCKDEPRKLWFMTKYSYTNRIHINNYGVMYFHRPPTRPPTTDHLPLTTDHRPTKKFQDQIFLKRKKSSNFQDQIYIFIFSSIYTYMTYCGCWFQIWGWFFEIWIKFTLFGQIWVKQSGCCKIFHLPIRMLWNISLTNKNAEPFLCLNIDLLDPVSRFCEE